MSLIDEKISILKRISTLEKLLDLASSINNGLIATIKLCLQLAAFTYASIHIFSLKNKLKNITRLIYEEERNANNSSEADRNEGIG